MIPNVGVLVEDLAKFVLFSFAIAGAVTSVIVLIAWLMGDYEPKREQLNPWDEDGEW